MDAFVLRVFRERNRSICVCVCVYVYVYVCLCVCVYVYVCMCVCVDHLAYPHTLTPSHPPSPYRHTLTPLPTGSASSRHSRNTVGD
jgi:hypothetical protein